MIKQCNNQYFIITGAMGGGKSTLLTQLKKQGVACINEPARDVLVAQRRVGGRGVPEKDPALFIDLMCKRAISDYNTMQEHAGPVFFDRGIPDALGYGMYFDLTLPSAHAASLQYRYNKMVFFANAWEAIYCTDNERTLSFSQARDIGNALKRIYANLGYTIFDLPLLSPQKRAQWVLDAVQVQCC